MKKVFVFAFLNLFAFSLFAQDTKNAAGMKPKVVLKNALDSANYTYGVVAASNAKRQMGEDLKMDVFLAAFNATLNGETTLFNNEDAFRLFTEYSRQAQQRAIGKTKEEGRKFLAENKKRAGVVETASGLQYEVMKKGTGAVSPKATDKVEVHYHGTMLDGTIFDSSVQRGQTATFGLNQVIKGWTEGVQYMKEGDKFKFFIPSDLAYGDRGAPGGKIKPGATLIFEVELFKVIAQ